PVPVWPRSSRPCSSATRPRAPPPVPSPAPAASSASFRRGCWSAAVRSYDASGGGRAGPDRRPLHRPINSTAVWSPAAWPAVRWGGGGGGFWGGGGVDEDCEVRCPPGPVMRPATGASARTADDTPPPVARDFQRLASAAAGVLPPLANGKSTRLNSRPRR